MKGAGTTVRSNGKEKNPSMRSPNTWNKGQPLPMRFSTRSSRYPQPCYARRMMAWARWLTGTSGSRDSRKSPRRSAFGQARSWLSRKHGIEAAEILRETMPGKLGARLKVVRPRRPNSCDLKRFKFATNCASAFRHPQGQRYEVRGRPLRLWIGDEARFGLQPSHRRAWVKRGQGAQGPVRSLRP